MEFKVGDRVRCTRNVNGYNTKGKIGTIKKEENTECVVDFDEDVEGWGDIGLGIEKGHGLYVYKKDLELIKENAFTLDDLKVGYLVELRDGKLHMVMESTDGKVLTREYGSYLELKDYSDNCKDKDGDSRYDIMKIYGFNEFKYKTLDFNTEDRKLLWERKEMLDNKDILNDKEKEYLSNFIKPFRDRVQHIKKWYKRTTNKYCIRVNYNDESFDTCFPILENKDMYKNMEADRAYTLEELEL